MTLLHRVRHPVRRHFVLKLDPEADPARGMVSGCLENLVTGHCFDLTGSAPLIQGLATELSLSDATTRLLDEKLRDASGPNESRHLRPIKRKK